MADTNETNIEAAMDGFMDYAKSGPNPEYVAQNYKLGLGLRQSLATYWQFVRDAVSGVGGFADGLYLYAHELEIENNKVTKKLKDRRDQADYDNFARDIMDAAWDQIVQSRDLITRRAPATGSTLDDFWKDVDGNGTHIMDFLEHPMRQARMYGTGYVFMDRGQNIGAYAAQSMSSGNRPWAYSVDSEYVVDWEFAPDGSIDHVVLIEPTGDDVWEYVGAKWAAPSFPHDILCWSKVDWCRFTAVPQRDENGKISSLGYVFQDGGPNTIGEVPMIPLFNDKPAPKHMIGDTEMPDVARLAQTVYNIDSEAREIERKCALFLALPVKNVKDYEGKTLVTGTDNVMLFDGDAGEPKWISPNLDILAKLEARRARIIESAYKMGHLRAILGAIKTQSGFHAEVEFAKTERRIARHAAQLEAFENKLAALYQKFAGETGEFEIAYPREYGVRDLERVIARAEIIYTMQLGDEVNKQASYDLLKTLYPRLPTDKLDGLVSSAVKSLAQARIEQQQAMMGGNVSGKGAGSQAMPGKGQPSQSQRIQKVLDRVNANTLGSEVKAGVDPEGA